MVEIELSNGFVTEVDAEDLAEIAKYHWHGRVNGPDVYVARTTSTRVNGVRVVRNIYLHRYLTNAPAGLTVDHKNGNSLDNRRSNLELVTQSENSRRRWMR